MAIQGEKFGLYLASKEIIIPECNIVITQPSVKNVLIFDETNFLSATQLLGHLDQVLGPMKKEIEQQLPTVNDLQLLLIAYQQDKMTRITISDFLTLIFPNYKHKFTESSIDFIQEDEVKGRITPFNLKALSNIILDLFEPSMLKKEEYHPTSKKAQEIADKIKRGKEKLAKKNGEDHQSLFGTYISILSIGMSIDINVLLEYTPFQLYDAFDRFILKEQEDYYKLLSSSGFLDTSKIEQPDSWLKNLY